MKYTLLALLLISNLSQAETLTFSKLMLVGESRYTDQEGGLLYKAREVETFKVVGYTPKTYSINGILLADSEEVILGRVALDISNYGLILFQLGVADREIDIDRVDGKQLIKLCSDYGGIGGGGTFIAGGENYAVTNSNGVGLRSSTATIQHIGGWFAAIDVFSYVNINIDCLDADNANWKNTILIKDEIIK